MAKSIKTSYQGCSIGNGGKRLAYTDLETRPPTVAVARLSKSVLAKQMYEYKTSKRPEVKKDMK